MTTDTLSLTDISTLPHDQLITLTVGQLLDLLAQAIEPLQARIEAVEATAARKDEIDDLRATVAAQDKKMAAVESLQEQDVTRIYCDIAQDRQRIAKLERPPAPTTTKKSTVHIDALYRLMVEDHSQQVSIAKAARLLGMSKERMRQLKPLILHDGRFEIGWTTVKGKRAAAIRIRQFL